jgi:hypothetical protein
VEEIKKLYEELYQIEDENERFKLWEIIIEKNRVLLRENIKKLKSI